MSRGMTSKGEPQMCDNCRFFSESTNADDQEQGIGFCNRFPHTERKPYVGWCGEHETDDENDMMMNEIAELLRKAVIVSVADNGED